MAQIIEFGAAPDIDAMDAAALRDYLAEIRERIARLDEDEPEDMASRHTTSGANSTKSSRTLRTIFSTALRSNKRKSRRAGNRIPDSPAFLLSVRPRDRRGGAGVDGLLHGAAVFLRRIERISLADVVQLEHGRRNIGAQAAADAGIIVYTSVHRDPPPFREKYNRKGGGLFAEEKSVKCKQEQQVQRSGAEGKQSKCRKEVITPVDSVPGENRSIADGTPYVRRSVSAG